MLFVVKAICSLLFCYDYLMRYDPVIVLLFAMLIFLLPSLSLIVCILSGMCQM